MQIATGIRRQVCAATIFTVSLPIAGFAKEDAAKLFGFDQIHSAHFVLSAEQWAAIKPKEPERGPGMFGGPAGRSGGPGGFSPGGMLVDGFLRALDGDKSGAISKDEFDGGFTRWFEAWDSKKQGFLDAEALRDGINKDLMPTFGRPPGAGTGGGPGGANGGGPGGAAGGPPGMTLQGREGQRNGLSGMAGIDFQYVHADLDFDGKKFSDVAVRYKGNGTYMDARNSEKKSLKVDLNEFVKGQKLEGLTTLNFHNNITDAAWMNESLAYALYRAAGVPAPRTSYTRVSITVPGIYDKKYFGLYSMVENTDKNWAKDRFDSKKGLILKPVTRELFVYKGTDWSAYRQAYDAKNDITDSQMRRVIDFAKLVSEANDEEFAAKLPEFLDIDQFARFMAVTVWLSSTDSILMVGQNYVVHLDPETKKFVFAPWDLDRAFGNFFVPDPEQLSIGKAWAEDNRFLNRVMNVPAMREAYTKRMEEFQRTIFEPSKLMKQIDEVASLIRPAVTEEGSEKAERFDKALVETEEAGEPERAGNPFGFRMGGRKIKVFIKARHQSVADQLAGKSEGKSLSSGFPGMGPGRGGSGRPGSGGTPGQGGGGQSQGAPRFGPGMFLGPTWSRAADADANGQITVAEFQGLSSRWIAEWDADHDGSVNEAELREGLTKAFPAPTFGQPPGTPQTR